MINTIFKTTFKFSLCRILFMWLITLAGKKVEYTKIQNGRWPYHVKTFSWATRLIEVQTIGKWSKGVKEQTFKKNICLRRLSSVRLFDYSFHIFWQFFDLIKMTLSRAIEPMWHSGIKHRVDTRYNHLFTA